MTQVLDSQIHTLQFWNGPLKQRDGQPAALTFQLDRRQALPQHRAVLVFPWTGEGAQCEIFFVQFEGSQIGGLIGVAIDDDDEGGVGVGGGEGVARG